MEKPNIKEITVASEDKPWLTLNATLGIPLDGKIQLNKDKEAVHEYFIKHVNKKTTFFTTLEEKINYLVEHNYLKEELFSPYDITHIKSLYKDAESRKFRFRTYMGAQKFYGSYALKTDDKENYLGRYEDTQVWQSLFFAEGNVERTPEYLDIFMNREFVPATPTMMNVGRARGGMLTSCYLMDIQDSMASIRKGIANVLELSRQGGGVSLNLSNLREKGAPIKKIKGAGSGVVPVMKLLEDSFSYSNQLG